MKMVLHYKKVKGSTPDATQGALMPFTRSQARELRVLQGLFMKRDAPECIMEPSPGFHVFMIAWDDERKEKEQVGHATL